MISSPVKVVQVIRVAPKMKARFSRQTKQLRVNPDSTCLNKHLGALHNVSSYISKFSCNQDPSAVHNNNDVLSRGLIWPFLKTKNLKWNIMTLP
jgi:hypothetical protein